MARKKKKKNKRKKRRSKDPFLVKNFLLMFFSILLVAGSIFGARHFFLQSGFFTIKEVLFTGNVGNAVSGEIEKLNRIYSGMNIFKVDLQKIKRMIASDMPEVKKVEVHRKMPDTLAVDIFSRNPAAVIDSSGGIVVDRDGVVLAVGTEREDLIRIRGLNFILNVPGRGEKIRSRALTKAMILISGIDRRLRGYRDRIAFIDISDENNIIIGVDGVPVKMGEGDYVTKLDTLRSMMRDPQLDFNEIRYIDLRFTDPVISPK